MANNIVLSLQKYPDKHMDIRQTGLTATGSQFVTLFRLTHGIENYTRPITTKKALVAVLEYPYALSELDGYMDIKNHKHLVERQVREYFPNTKKVIFSVAGKNERCELFAYVDKHPELSKKKNEKGVETWKYKYTLHFQELYVISQPDNYLLQIIVPTDMAETLKTYHVWEQFKEELKQKITEILPAHVVKDNITDVDFDVEHMVQPTIHIPINHIVDEGCKAALAQATEVAKATKTIDLELLQFIQRNAASGQALRKASIVQPGDFNREFVIGNACEERLFLTGLFPEHKDEIWSMPITDVQVAIDHFFGPLVIGAASCTVGGALIYGGGKVMILSIASAPATSGISLLAFPVGLLVFMAGGYLIFFGSITTIKYAVDLANRLGIEIKFEPDIEILPDFPPAHDDHEE